MTIENLSDRKRRLFGCACYRHVWDSLPEKIRQNIEVAEFIADKWTNNKPLTTAAIEAEAEHVAVLVATDFDPYYDETNEWCPSPSEDAYNAEKSYQASLLEHIGKPYKTDLTFCESIRHLAHALYNGSDCSFALHDALLEAGHHELAEHFREREHPKGCWALDAILGRH